MQHLLIPFFRSASSIEQKSCRMNQHNLIRKFISFIQEQMINRRLVCPILAYSSILIRRIANNHIKLKILTHNTLAPFTVQHILKL